jgi:acetyl-CoA acetyltransferase
MNIYVLGAATTKFGELWGTSPRALARQAVDGALLDAGIDKRRVEALFVGNMLSGMLGSQEHLGAFLQKNYALLCRRLKLKGHVRPAG